MLPIFSVAFPLPIMTNIPGKLQQERFSIIKLTTYLDSLALFTLPSDYCPGSDLMSKIMLKDERLMDTILKDVVGNHASSALYTLGRCEWVNKTISDVLYLPITSNLPPVLAEIQNKVSEHFIRRAIKHYLSLEEEYGVQPIMLVFSIEGFANERPKSKFINTNNNVPPGLNLENFYLFFKS